MSYRVEYAKAHPGYTCQARVWRRSVGYPSVQITGPRDVEDVDINVEDVGVDVDVEVEDVDVDVDVDEVQCTLAGVALFCCTLAGVAFA